MGQDGAMTLDITVRGSAQKWYAAERAVLSLSAAVEGLDKQQVLTDAVAIQDPIVDQLHELVDRGAATTFDSEQVRVYSQRPWGPDGTRLPLTHYANVAVQAEFVGFERLSGFIDYWAGRDGVEVGGIEWDVTVKNRRVYEADVRRAAVEDAVTKAQGYADALRRGRVHATRLADPGMLQDLPPSPVMPMAKLAMAEHTGGPQLTLTPGQIAIRVEVDAKFIAD